MSATIPFKRLIRRAFLRGVSPMIARLISVSVNTVSFGLRIVFHDRASLSDSNASALPCPRFEMLSKFEMLSNSVE
jgi:hypothetical protein